MEDVRKLINEVKETSQKVSSSNKDEIRIMKAMLNDKDYSVDVYGKNGVEGTFCPAKEARTLITSVISGAAKIPHDEAEVLSDSYEFKKSDAINMVNISKEFVNTYLESGRKLPLGGRETSNVSLVKKEVPAKETTYPKRIGVDENGNPIYKTEPTSIKAHSTIKVSGSCPPWVK